MQVSDYLGMTAVHARDLLTHERNIATLREVAAQDARVNVKTKAEARIRAVLKETPEVAEPVTFATAGPKVSHLALVPDLVVDDPKPERKPRVMPPKRQSTLTAEQVAEATTEFGPVTVCTKCGVPKPTQWRKMASGKIRPQAQCGTCRGSRR